MSDIELALNTGDKAESAPEKKEPRRQRNESKISIIFETKMFSLQELSPNYRHVFYKGLFSEFMVTFFFLFLVLAVDINCIRNAYEPLTTSIIVTVNVFLIALGLLYSFGHHGPNIDPVLTFSLLGKDFFDHSWRQNHFTKSCSELCHATFSLCSSNITFRCCF